MNHILVRSFVAGVPSRPDYCSLQYRRSRKQQPNTFTRLLHRQCLKLLNERHFHYASVRFDLCMFSLTPPHVLPRVNHALQNSSPQFLGNLGVHPRQFPRNALFLCPSSRLLRLHLFIPSCCRYHLASAALANSTVSNNMQPLLHWQQLLPSKLTVLYLDISRFAGNRSSTQGCSTY